MEKLNDTPYIPDLKGMGFTAPIDDGIQCVIHHSTCDGSSSDGIDRDCCRGYLQDDAAQRLDAASRATLCFLAYPPCPSRENG